MVLSPSERDLVRDPDHERFLTLAADQVVLLTGPAGTGKTTLALRRLAAHARSAEHELNAVVVVPVQDLVRHIERLCARLGVSALVTTFDDWVFQQARRAFPDVGKRRSETMPVGAIAFKRHPAVQEVLPELVCPGDKIVREHLLDLWGDDRLLADIVESSQGELTWRMAQQTRDHAIIQHSERERDEKGRVLTSFGLPLDDGTPMHDSESLAPEDLTVLFALRRLAAGAKRVLPPIDHLVIDEAQELAPLELTLLGAALRRRGAMTIAGDEAQQLDPTAWFRGWEQSVRAIGLGSIEHFSLERGFRSHPEITRFIRALASAEPLPPPSERVRWEIHPDGSERDAALREILERWPREKSCAIISSTPSEAERLRSTLRPGPAVLCTSVSHVRGQEFDLVLVADAGPQAFPESARKALYVATSRARERLELHAIGELSPLLSG